MTEESRFQNCYNDHAAPVEYEGKKLFLVSIISLRLTVIDRIIDVAIRFSFERSEQIVRNLMKQQLKFSSCKLWRMRVEACKT